jgi:hypothetical protein
MNELKHYLLFNPELKKFNLTYIKKQYINDLHNNNVVSIDTFFKKYKDFDIDIYKKIAELYDNDKSFTLPTEHSYYIKLYNSIPNGGRPD